MGCGKNGTFDKMPDIRQWGILMVSTSLHHRSKEEIDYTRLYGSLIAGGGKFSGVVRGLLSFSRSRGMEHGMAKRLLEICPEIRNMKV